MSVKRAVIHGKRADAHQCRRYMATTQLAMGRSPLDVQRQMGHTSLKMTNHYASLTVQQLHKSHEKYSPLKAEMGVAPSASAISRLNQTLTQQFEAWQQRPLQLHHRDQLPDHRLGDDPGYPLA